MDVATDSTVCRRVREADQSRASGQPLSSEGRMPEWLDRRRRLVGYLLAIYLFSLEHGGMMAEIDEFFVLNEKRSLNIGTALLNTVMRTMTQEGITHLQLQLGTQNSRGKRFYERQGFRSTSGRDLLGKSLGSGT